MQVGLAYWLIVLSGKGSDPLGGVSASHPATSVSFSHSSFLQHMLLGISFVPDLSLPLEPGQGVGDDVGRVASWEQPGR